MTDLRLPTDAELPALATLWHDAWHDAHAAHVPPELLAARDRASFRLRFTQARQHTRAAWDNDGPLGFCTIAPPPENELDQLFVAPRARGTALAAALLADGEARLRALGTRVAVLKCLPQNHRALTFYRREGWHDTGTEVSTLKTVRGTCCLPCQILRKDLT